MPFRVALLVAGTALVAVFTLIGAWTVRMAVADYQFRLETLPGTREALRTEPDSADYCVRLAESAAVLTAPPRRRVQRS